MFQLFFLLLLCLATNIYAMKGEREDCEEISVKKARTRNEELLDDGEPISGLEIQDEQGYAILTHETYANRM